MSGACRSICRSTFCMRWCPSLMPFPHKTGVSCFSSCPAARAWWERRACLQVSGGKRRHDGNEKAQFWAAYQCVFGRVVSGTMSRFIKKLLFGSSSRTTRAEARRAERSWLVNKQRSFFTEDTYSLSTNGPLFPRDKRGAPLNEKSEFSRGRGLPPGPERLF